MTETPNIAELIDILVTKAKTLGWEEDQGSFQGHMDAEEAYVAARQNLDLALRPLIEQGRRAGFVAD